MKAFKVAGTPKFQKAVIGKERTAERGRVFELLPGLSPKKNPAKQTPSSADSPGPET